MKTDVLLVDDEREFVLALAKRLALRGFSTACAHDGDEALAYLSAHDAPVVVLDVNMPGRSGVDVLREIKEMRPATEVVMLTGATDVGTAVAGMKLGASDYLQKPVDVEVLAQAVRQAKALLDRRLGRERMEDVVRMAALGRLAEGLAHEINNPVNVMVQEAGWMGDLLEEPGCRSLPEYPDLIKAVDRIEHQGKRCRAITAKLLRFGKKNDPRVRPVNLNAVLERCLADRAPRLAELKVVTVLKLDPELPEMTLAPADMDHLFGNLLDNALDAMAQPRPVPAADPLDDPKDGPADESTAPRGGTLTVTTRVRDAHLTVAIADTGLGITPEDLPRLFEPFFSTKDVGQGTGLGLSICYGIVSGLSGEIAAHGEPGKGAEFVVRLPRSRADS
jgi:signal transduction histidine kinase